MTTTLSPPIRILALVGVVAAAGLGIFVFTSSRSSSDSASSAAIPASNSSRSQATKTHASTVPARPKIILVPGLPARIAHSLQFSRVVVVSLFAPGAKGDMAAVAEARAGARSAHSGFVAISVVNDRVARKLPAFAGTATTPPAVLVVKRPGKIVNRFDGFVDSQIVAQAATNAGARAR